MLKRVVQSDRGFAVLGAAFFTAGYTQTISTAVIVLEMTGEARLLIPMLCGCVVSFLLSRLLTSNAGIYERLAYDRHLPFVADLPVAKYPLTARDVMVPVDWADPRGGRITLMQSATSLQEIDTILESGKGVCLFFWSLIASREPRARLPCRGLVRVADTHWIRVLFRLASLSAGNHGALVCTSVGRRIGVHSEPPFHGQTVTRVVGSIAPAPQAPSRPLTDLRRLAAPGSAESAGRRRGVDGGDEHGIVHTMRLSRFMCPAYT